ncbi:MAG TPA: FtsW/RodA/SpoVE family cell cycle protein [Anaerolineales bacterium]|nr:FtsW/RodA/SpoVE family cell cycle protein [Anaerolineales bacterium]
MQFPTRVWRHFDVLLLAAAAVLTIAGVAMIRSAIGGNENLAELVPRQAIYAVIGFVVLLIMAAIDYRIWSGLARPLYLFTIGILGLIQIAGFVGFGAARWFNVGIATIQPSELAKIFMILVLAEFLSRNQAALERFSTVLRSLVLIGVPLLLIFIQPDLSTAIVVLVIWFAQVWVIGIRIRHLGLLIGIALLLTLLFVPLMARYFLTGYVNGEDFLFLQYYQMERLVTFLLPDPSVQHGASYNVNQALISIGSGGLFGQGYGHGTQVQLRFLKVRHTDFIFSAMAEEFGFAGALIFLITLIFVILRCLRAARRARDTFGALICYSVAILLLFQGAFNVGMNLNMFPVSGLPLPFLSYGGSSLLASLFGVGLVESVNLRHKQIEL